MISYRGGSFHSCGGIVADDRPDLRAPATGPPHPARPQRFEGAAADGLVTVTVSETGELLGVHIYPGEYRRDDPPGLANMGDMVVEALQAAKARAAGFANGHPTAPDRD
jgi:YbaB/EbfC DNA-binding family